MGLPTGPPLPGRVRRILDRPLGFSRPAPTDRRERGGRRRKRSGRPSPPNPPPRNRVWLVLAIHGVVPHRKGRCDCRQRVRRDQVFAVLEDAPPLNYSTLPPRPGFRFRAQRRPATGVDAIPGRIRPTAWTARLADARALATDAACDRCGLRWQCPNRRQFGPAENEGHSLTCRPLNHVCGQSVRHCALRPDRISICEESHSPIDLNASTHWLRDSSFESSRFLPRRVHIFSITLFSRSARSRDRCLSHPIMERTRWTTPVPADVRLLDSR